MKHQLGCAPVKAHASSSLSRDGRWLHNIERRWQMHGNNVLNMITCPVTRRRKVWPGPPFSQATRSSRQAMAAPMHVTIPAGAVPRHAAGHVTESALGPRRRVAPFPSHPWRR